MSIMYYVACMIIGIVLFRLILHDRLPKEKLKFHYTCFITFGLVCCVVSKIATDHLKSLSSAPLAVTTTTTKTITPEGDTIVVKSVATTEERGDTLITTTKYYRNGDEL
tara:strand:+ start:13361 stop:13687 length:327 start_codon:yes stop_codon:yes gene_type:complete